MWKRAMFAVVCMVLGVSGLAQAQGQTQTAAMIVSSADLSLGFDQPMHDRLAALGYDVTVVVSSEVGSGFTVDEANTYDLLLVSESIGSSSADPLIGTTTPVMHNESYGWDNWSLTTGANMHWVSGASVDIVNDAHPIAAMAGVHVGPMAFFTSSASWTTDSVSALAPGAELIAQINEAGTDVAIIFAVEEGAQLANGNSAPNRIAGFSMPGNNVYDAGAMTNQAWALFDATIRWLTRSVLPTVAEAPRPADTATDVPRDVVLRWGPGDSADTHDVYFGTNFDDVNDASHATRATCWSVKAKMRTRMILAVWNTEPPTTGGSMKSMPPGFHGLQRFGLEFCDRALCLSGRERNRHEQRDLRTRSAEDGRRLRAQRRRPAFPRRVRHVAGGPC